MTSHPTIDSRGVDPRGRWRIGRWRPWWLYAHLWATGRLRLVHSGGWWPSLIIPDSPKQLVAPPRPPTASRGLPSRGSSKEYSATSPLAACWMGGLSARLPRCGVYMLML